MTPNSAIRRLLITAMVLAGPVWVFAPLAVRWSTSPLVGVPADQREAGRRSMSRLKNLIKTDSYDRTSATATGLMRGCANAIADALPDLDLADVITVRVQSKLRKFEDDDTRDLIDALTPVLDRIDPARWQLLVLAGERGMLRALNDPFATLGVHNTWTNATNALVDLQNDTVRLPGHILLVPPPRPGALGSWRAATTLNGDGFIGSILDLRGVSGGDSSAARNLLGPLLPANTKIADVFEPRSSQGAEPLFAGMAKDAKRRSPTVVLVDGKTAGAAELIAATLRRQIPPVPLVGTKTLGAPLLTYQATLDERPWFDSALATAWPDTVTISSASFLLPDGTDLMSRGLNPDAIVETTGAPGVDPREDPALARAVLLLLDLADIDPSSIPEYRDLK